MRSTVKLGGVVGVVILSVISAFFVGGIIMGVFASDPGQINKFYLYLSFFLGQGVIILPPIYYLNIKKKPILNSFRLNPISGKIFQNSTVFSLGVIIIFDTFGPNDWRQKLFHAITKAVKTNEVIPIPAGNVPMYPVYIADVIDCYILAAQKLASKPNEIINKCFAVRGNDETSIHEIIRTFEQVTDKKIYTEIGAWPASTREIKNIWLGSTMSDWSLKYNLAEGIKKIFEAHNEGN